MITEDYTKIGRWVVLDPQGNAVEETRKAYESEALYAAIITLGQSWSQLLRKGYTVKNEDENVLPRV